MYVHIDIHHTYTIYTYTYAPHTWALAETFLGGGGGGQAPEKPSLKTKRPPTRRKRHQKGPHMVKKAPHKEKDGAKRHQIEQKIAKRPPYSGNFYLGVHDHTYTTYTCTQHIIHMWYYTVRHIELSLLPHGRAVCRVICSTSCTISTSLSSSDEFRRVPPPIEYLRNQ